MTSLQSVVSCQHQNVSMPCLLRLIQRGRVLFEIVHCRTLCLLPILMQIMYNGKNVNTADGFGNW
jgi:hypothetical protein